MEIWILYFLIFVVFVWLFKLAAHIDRVRRVANGLLAPNIDKTNKEVEELRKEVYSLRQELEELKNKI